MRPSDILRKNNRRKSKCGHHSVIRYLWLKQSQTLNIKKGGKVRKKTRIYKQEILNMLKNKPRRKVKRKLYDDKKRHKKLGITETTCNRIWSDLMQKRNPMDIIEEKVYVVYTNSGKLVGVFKTAKAIVGRFGIVSGKELLMRVNTEKGNGRYVFRRENRAIKFIKK